MKKVISLVSMLFVLLLAVLPASVSQAAGTTPVNVTGVSLVTTDNAEIKAVGSDNNFKFDLTGLSGDVKIKSLKVTSDTAKTLSLFSKDEASNPGDAYDIQFTAGVVNIDKQRVLDWTDKFGDLIYEELFPSGKGTDYLFTVQDLRNVIKSEDLFDGNFGYVTDASNNESELSVTFKTEGWNYENGKWFFYNNSAVKATGWLQDGANWYYLGTDGTMATGWVLYNGAWYYLKANGVMATGWVSYNGAWYYLNATGDMATGWVLYNGAWYYLNASGVMATGWVSYNGAWYYLNAGGVMSTGWVSYNGAWYYLNSTGVMATGWVKDGSAWFYLKSSGVMATGSLKISNKWYYFTAGGVWYR